MSGQLIVMRLKREYRELNNRLRKTLAFNTPAVSMQIAMAALAT